MNNISLLSVELELPLCVHGMFSVHPNQQSQHGEASELSIAILFQKKITVILNCYI